MGMIDTHKARDENAVASAQITPVLHIGPFPRCIRMIPRAATSILNLSRESHPAHLFTTDINITHRPFAYWELSDPISVLDDINQEVLSEIRRGRCVFAHCHLGIDRSGLIALTYLTKITGSQTLAIELYQLRRPGIRLPRADAMELFFSWCDVHAYR